MRKNVPATLLILVLVATIFLAGCQAARPASLSNDQVVAVIANILTSINAGDYAGFSKDFSPDLKNAMPETQFNSLAALLLKTSGKYVSCDSTPELSNSQEFAVYRLSCKFELEPVIVTTPFKVGGSQVEGLYFDSTNLRNVK